MNETLEEKNIELLREYKNRPLALLLGDKPYEERGKDEIEHVKELQNLCVRIYRIRKKRLDHHLKMKRLDKKMVDDSGAITLSFKDSSAV